MEGATLTTGVDSGWSVPAPTPAADTGALAALHPGVVLGSRYEILQLLGQGGMGVVFKAKDRELDRLVAIKVIRPELAGNPEVLQRFKQELILARQITHKNVIRIFDLGQADGWKFITMEYIDGQDLKTLLRRRGKIPPPEAGQMIQQVCRALEAAHSEGVVHRDLKPQNIMLEQQGRVAVMDFGIARSVEQAGLTRTGALIGTPEYMSPEQARAQKVDARSDLFSLGVIFYELLTGKTPFEADTALGMLLRRTQERATPPTQINPDVPALLNDIVVKMLATEREQRYQSAQDVLHDLEAWLGGRPAKIPTPPLAQTWRILVSRRRLAVVVAVMLLALGGVLWRGKLVHRLPARQETVRVLVADFANETGEPIFSATVEPMFTLALEGASFITSYNRVQARRTGQELQPSATKLDEELARLVAVREGVNAVVGGSIVRQGAGYAVSVRVVDAATGKTLAQEKVEASSKEAVLGAVSKLAASVRKALGDTTPESLQIAAAETFSAGSLEAAHRYAVAQELQQTGKSEEAIEAYVQAVAADPNLGRAYSGLAAVNANLGRYQEAEKYYKLAMARIDRMTDREKYRTRGGYYLLTRNHQKAIEEFSALVKQYPADSAGYANVALAYFYRRDMTRALEEGRKATQIYPKNVPQRNNVALYAMYAGDFETALREARAVLELNPKFLKAHVALALSLLGQGKTAEAVEAYHRLEPLSPRGASFASIGQADAALYEGRVTEATGMLERGIAADVASKNAEAAACKWVALAEAQLARNQKAAALSSVAQALAASKQESALYAAASLYLHAGEEARALPLASQLNSRLDPDSQAYAKLIEGERQRERGNLPEAIRLFQGAQKLADTWLGRFHLGRAYLDSGAFTEAYSEFELCLKRRGEATAVFLDDIPSYRYLPQVYYYLGRAQDGLQSSGGAESYRAFLSIKQKADDHPLIRDARQRLAGR